MLRDVDQNKTTLFSQQSSFCILIPREKSMKHRDCYNHVIVYSNNSNWAWRGGSQICLLDRPVGDCCWWCAIKTIVTLKLFSMLFFPFCFVRLNACFYMCCFSCACKLSASWRDTVRVHISKNQNITNVFVGTFAIDKNIVTCYAH